MSDQGRREMRARPLTFPRKGHSRVTFRATIEASLPGQRRRLAAAAAPSALPWARVLDGSCWGVQTRKRTAAGAKAARKTRTTMPPSILFLHPRTRPSRLLIPWSGGASSAWCAVLGATGSCTPHYWVEKGCGSPPGGLFQKIVQSRPVCCFFEPAPSN